MKTELRNAEYQMGDGAYCIANRAPNRGWSWYICRMPWWILRQNGGFCDGQFDAMIQPTPDGEQVIFDGPGITPKTVVIYGVESNVVEAHAAADRAMHCLVHAYNLCEQETRVGEPLPL